MGNWCTCCLRPSDSDSSGPSSSSSPSPIPIPGPRPSPASSSELEGAPGPSPTPGPSSKLDGAPRPRPRPTPGPSSKLDGPPGPRPTPVSSSELDGTPESRPTPGPSSELDGAPGPRPTPGPSSELDGAPGPRPTPGPSSELDGVPGPRPTPGPSSELDGGSKHVKSKCKSKVHKEAAKDTVPAIRKSKRLNSLALKGYHRKNISAPAMAQEQVKKNNDEFPGRLIKRYGSCPTVFLYDDTVSQPNFSTVIQAVSMAIYNNIRYRIGNRTKSILDERRYPFRHELITKKHFLHAPKLETVYRFVCTLFSAEHLTAECAIVTLIYLERARQKAIIDVCPSNWKRMLLGAAIVAYEMWDKQALWDVPYCQLINNIITVEDMNKIEMHFLSYIDYETNVPASLYAKYYFDLRYLAHEHNPLVLVKNLCKERAQSTETISRGSQEKDLCRAAIERSLSADNVIDMQRTKPYSLKKRRGCNIMTSSSTKTREMPPLFLKSSGKKQLKR